MSRPSNISELSGLIKAKAFDLGFQHCGIARAEALGVEAERFNEWLGRGYHASMAWMARDPLRRSDPRQVLPGAQSVISVAMNYYTPVGHADDPRTGKVSRYAWGDDYHLILQQKLEALLEYIRSIADGVEGRMYVDTGPVLEKAWAQRAGIGWIGKHANLITQEHGSWIFLGELLLNIRLDYDSPATDHCGECTLCIQACPTGAITEPYVVDANRCISYLTIEHRGPIDPQFEGQFEQWVYGCDICQDVCPWNNKFSEPSGIPQFEPRPQNIAPDLRAWATMTDEEFRTLFAKSPIKRTKAAGLRRNAEFIIDHTIPDTSSESNGTV